MNYNINSSGIYDVNAYNLTSNNATILSSLNVGGAIIGPNTISSISNLNITSTSIINNLNSLSSYSYLNINTTNTNLNNLSNYSYLNINTTNTNLNNLSNYSYLNINTTNTKLNSLSSQSFFLTNYTNLNSLNVSGITILNNTTSINSSLNVSGILNIYSNTINNYLFNNTGQNHSTYQDFNNIDKFGYTFIQNTTNGPGTGSNQYYSWYIGLGNEYPFPSNVNGRYGMQFAVGRGETNPKLSIRRMEGNNWTSWEGLTSEKAVSLTSGDKTISGSLNINNNLNVSGTTILNNNTSINSSLNISGISIFNNSTSINSSLNVSGNTILNFTTINNRLSMACNLWHVGTDYNERFYFVASGPTCICSGGNTTSNNLVVYSSSAIGSYNNNLVIQNNGNTQIRGSLLISGTTTLQNSTTLYSSLYVSGATILNNTTSINNSLNVSGITTLSNNTIINGTTQLDPKILLSGQEYLVPSTTSTDGIALLLGANRINTRLLFIADSTKLIQNATNPVVSINPTGRFDCTSTDSTTRLPAVFNGALFTNGTYNITCISSLNISGNTTLNNITTCGSSLNVSGNTTLNNITTCGSSLNVSGNTLLNNITTINSSLNVNGNTTGVLVNIIQNMMWNDGVNYALNVSGYSMFGGVQINGQDTNNIYKRVGDLTIASPSLSSIILKTNYGSWEAMRLNTAGTSINTSLYVSGLTTFNNNITCLSSLNVSGVTTLSNNIIINGNINVGTTDYSTATKMHIKGSSSGYSQPLVRIEQTLGWNGNYALQVVGYSDFNGLRINGADTSNTIYTTGANDMALSTNAGVIKFGVNGAERMRISSDGIVKVAVDNYLRLEGSTTGKALSIGGYGLFEVDAPGVVGGRFSIDNSGNVKCKGTLTSDGTITCPSIATTVNTTGLYIQNGGNCIVSGKISIANLFPMAMLQMGTVTAVSDPGIVMSKNNGGGIRNLWIGYNPSFFFGIGDYGNTNSSGSNTLTIQLGIIYSAPASSLVIQASGYVQMQYGYGTGSDERIKTNIRTIENALDKTLLLRGVEYNDIRIEPERKKIGLIAQEVELIIPEVVRTNEQDGLKSIEYQNLVALLIEAIKSQQKQINELKLILKNNNLN